LTTREKILWLALSVFIAQTIGWVLVHTGQWTGVYEVLAWFTFFVVNCIVLKSFWYAVAWTVTAAAIQDFLYIVTQNAVTQDWVWYSHTWVKDLPIPFSKYFGYNWLGVPSGYFLQPLVSIVIALPRYFRWYQKAGRWILDMIYSILIFRRTEG
jgi:hypothetical protein